MPGTKMMGRFFGTCSTPPPAPPPRSPAGNVGLWHGPRSILALEGTGRLGVEPLAAPLPPLLLLRPPQPVLHQVATKPHQLTTKHRTYTAGVWSGGWGVRTLSGLHCQKKNKKNGWMGVSRKTGVWTWSALWGPHVGAPHHVQ